jgi:hypothetical protein
MVMIPKNIASCHALRCTPWTYRRQVLASTRGGAINAT